MSIFTKVYFRNNSPEQRKLQYLDELHLFDKKKLLTAKETAAYLGISLKMVYSLKDEARIPFVQLGRLVMFDRDELEKWIKNNSVCQKNYF